MVRPGRSVAFLLLGLILAAAAFAGSTPSARLAWTAPGDDGTIGKAALYEGRYATTRPDTSSLVNFEAWWNASRPIPGFPLPRIAGAADTVLVAPVGGFSADSSYFFVIRTADEVPNYSPLSNIAVMARDSIPPARISSVRILP